MATYDDAIIFINNSELTPKKSRYLKNNLSILQSFKIHFAVPPYHMPYRILSSLIPPIFSQSQQRIYIDLLGPLLALLSLAGLLHYGHASKLPIAASKISPTETLLVYSILMPVLSFILSRLAQSSISFIEMISILGYSLYGHIFTLLVSLVLYDEESNFFFFMCLLIFGGLSTLRVVLILVALIPKPALRLVICSAVSIIQLLFLVFLHFLYMHRTFRYGRKYSYSY